MSQGAELVFFGEVLPGFDAGEARARLLALLKLPAEQGDHLFSGQRVVLKRRLSSDEGEKYRQYLAGIGIKVSVEQAVDPAPVAAAAAPAPVAAAAAPAAVAGAVPLPSTPAAPEPVAPPAAPRAAGGLELADDPRPPREEAAAPGAAAAGPAAGEVSCPNCGEVQPKRTLCRKCGTDMPRMRAAMEAPREDEYVSPLVDDKAYIAMHDGAPPAALFGWRFQGRMGRLRYFVGGLFLTGLAFLAFALIASMNIWWASVAILPVMAWQGIRFSVLRCHDCGWSGWWALLGLLPYVGWVFNLVLLFYPSQHETSQHGMMDTAPAMPVVAGAVAVWVLGAAIGFSALGSFGNDFAAEMATAGSVAEDSAGAESALQAAYDSGDVLVMYTTQYCGPCDTRREQLDKLGVRYRLVALDQDPNAFMELGRKLQEAGENLEPGDPPIFDANGELLFNPSLDELAVALTD